MIDELKDVCQLHRVKILVGATLVVSAIALIILFIRPHHHHHTSPPLPTLTLLNFSSTPTGYNFSLLFSDPVRKSVMVTPMITPSSSFNGTLLGQPVTFSPPDVGQTGFSGVLSPSLPPAFSRPSLRPSIHVDTRIDREVRGWLCPTFRVPATCPLITAA